MTPMKQLWVDLNTPSEKSETLHEWGAIQATHGLMGAAVSHLLPVSAWISGGLAMLYFGIKERRDLARGGSLSDSINDAVYVGIGLYSPFLSGFPLVLMIAVFIGVLIRSLFMKEE